MVMDGNGTVLETVFVNLSLDETVETAQVFFL